MALFTLCRDLSYNNFSVGNQEPKTCNQQNVYENLYPCDLLSSVNHEVIWALTESFYVIGTCLQASQGITCEFYISCANSYNM